MDGQLESSSNPSVPLLSRADRLDCLMKYIAGKTSLWRGYNFSFGKKKRDRYMPSYVAVEEEEEEEDAAQLKGTLLDRISSLEARLVQLALEIESRKSLASTSASVYASTSSGGRETNSSYPTFNNPKRWQPQSSQLHQITSDVIQISNPDRLLRRNTNNKKEEGNARNQKFGNKNKKRDDKKCKNSWPHLRILGC